MKKDLLFVVIICTAVLCATPALAQTQKFSGEQQVLITWDQPVYITSVPSGEMVKLTDGRIDSSWEIHIIPDPKVADPQQAKWQFNIHMTMHASGSNLTDGAYCKVNESSPYSQSGTLNDLRWKSAVKMNLNCDGQPPVQMHIIVGATYENGSFSFRVLHITYPGYKQTGNGK